MDEIKGSSLLCELLLDVVLLSLMGEVTGSTNSGIMVLLPGRGKTKDSHNLIFFFLQSFDKGSIV